jgi:DNA-binding NtrC family response regulator
MNIKTIIRKVERHQHSLEEILADLRLIEGTGPLKTDHEAPLDHFEKRLLLGALERAKGNKSEAARLLKISRDRLRYKMAKHGLNPPNPHKR